MLVCPFCGAPETDRFDLEGRRFLVFRCLFSPEIDPRATDEATARWLGETFREGAGDGYFRQMCDRLHLYVTRDPTARERDASESEPSAEP